MPVLTKTNRTYDATGIPFHKDGKTVIKERIYLDKADPNLLRDEITTIDNALTRPWSAVKTYAASRPNSRSGGARISVRKTTRMWSSATRIIF